LACGHGGGENAVGGGFFFFFGGGGGGGGGREIGLNPCAQITEGEKKPNLFLSELIISRRIVEIFYNKKNFNHQNFKKGD